MSLSEWFLTALAAVVPVVLAFASWLAVVYKKVNEIAVHIEGIHSFMGEAKADVKQHGLAIQELKGHVTDHGRRIEHLERHGGVA